MKTRQVLVKKLMKEGFKADTLASFSDKQIENLAKKILNENFKVKADDLKRDSSLADKLKDKDVTVVPESEIHETPKKGRKFKTLDFKEMKKEGKKAVESEFYETTTKKNIVTMVKESIEKYR